MDKSLLDTRQVADYLSVNEKQVYTLIRDRGLPGTRVTGKWIFPRHLVDRWLESQIPAAPFPRTFLDQAEGLLLIAGSDDILLSSLVSLFRKLHPETIPLVSRAGSGEGIVALNRGLCHLAAIHLMNPVGEDYNTAALGERVALVGFCRRQQGLIVAKDNPLGISSLEDALTKKARWALREPGTGTRLLFDRLREGLGGSGETAGTSVPADSHMEAALAVLQGKADAAIAIRPVAEMLGLVFLPLREERFDLAVRREIFFQRPVRDFLDLLRDDRFTALARELPGYDVADAGRLLN